MITSKQNAKVNIKSTEIFKKTKYYIYGIFSNSEAPSNTAVTHKRTRKDEYFNFMFEINHENLFSCTRGDLNSNNRYLPHVS